MFVERDMALVVEGSFTVPKFAALSFLPFDGISLLSSLLNNNADGFTKSVDVFVVVDDDEEDVEFDDEFILNLILNFFLNLMHENVIFVLIPYISIAMFIDICPFNLLLLLQDAQKNTNSYLTKKEIFIVKILKK